MDPCFQDRSQRRSANSGDGGSGDTYATGGTVSSGALFAEPETYGCQLIPLRGISQSRAVGLMRTVADAYGFTVPTDGGLIGQQVIRWTGARDPDDGAAGVLTKA